MCLYDQIGVLGMSLQRNLIGLSNERPILGDNPKAHNEKPLRFSWKVAVFVKSIAVFVKSGSFYEKHCSFHLKSEKHNEKHQKQLTQHRSLIWTCCFIEYRGKANWVYLIFWWYLVVHMCLVVHVCVYGAHICSFNCACMWCMYVHVVICTHLVVHVCAYGTCMCMWCICEKHTWKVKST